MESLSEYLKIAEHIIAKSGYPFLLKDEDAISWVAEYIMTADSQYDESIGTKFGYRKQYAFYGMGTWLKNLGREGKNPVALPPEYFDTMTTGCNSQEIRMDYLDALDILKNSGLNNKQIIAYILRHRDSWKYEDIGKELGVCRSWASALVHQAEKILKNGSHNISNN